MSVVFDSWNADTDMDTCVVECSPDGKYEGTNGIAAFVGLWSVCFIPLR